MTPTVEARTYATHDLAEKAWRRVDEWLQTQRPILAVSVQAETERGAPVVIVVVEDDAKLEGCPWDGGARVEVDAALRDSLLARLPWVKENVDPGTRTHASFPPQAEYTIRPDGTVGPDRRPQG